MNKSFWIAAAKRALHAVAQTALSMIGATSLIEHVNWLAVLSASALAGVISLLKSITIGMPEAPIEQRKPPDNEKQITVKAYDDYYEDGSPMRLGDVVFPESVDCEECEACDLTPYLTDNGGENE